jgi:hypothetical protein
MKKIRAQSKGGTSFGQPENKKLGGKQMKPADIVSALENRGWQAKLIGRTQVSDLVPVCSEGLFKCVDGRLSDQDNMRGPKVLGGVYGIAATRGVDDIDGLEEIVEEVKNAGYVPCVHGDEMASPASMGCGFFKLWSTGQLPDLPKPSYDSIEGQDTVESKGGVYETLKGAHSESKVLINLVPDTTLEPKEDQRFVVDAWITENFGLDPATYLTLAAETVERLNGPLVAEIIVD